MSAAEEAGRYGIGSHTAEILKQQGYEVDLSVCPSMNYASEGGPDFSTFNSAPFWLDKERSLLEIPMTVGQIGLLRKEKALYETSRRFPYDRIHLGGILARSGMPSKVWLFPEGYTFSENVALRRALYGDGLRHFTYALHSPSLEPGNTPYVRTQKDLERLLTHCRDFFAYFLTEFGGIPSTPLMSKAGLGHIAALRNRRIE